MQALLKFSRAVDWLNGLVGKYVIWLILGATLISAGNAAVRKMFGVSSAERSEERRVGKECRSRWSPYH